MFSLICFSVVRILQQIPFYHLLLNHLLQLNQDQVFRNVKLLLVGFTRI